MADRLSEHSAEIRASAVSLPLLLPMTVDGLCAALLTVGRRLEPLGALCEILIENLMRFTLLHNNWRKTKVEKGNINITKVRKRWRSDVLHVLEGKIKMREIRYK